MPKIYVQLLLKIDAYTTLVFPRPNSKFVHPHYLVKIPNAKSVHVNHVFGWCRDLSFVLAPTTAHKGSWFHPSEPATNSDGDRV